MQREKRRACECLPPKQQIPNSMLRSGPKKLEILGKGGGDFHSNRRLFIQDSFNPWSRSRNTAVLAVEVWLRLDAASGH